MRQAGLKMQEKKGVKNLRIKKVTVVGIIPSFAFQRAKYCALELHRNIPERFPLPEIVGLLELDWSEKLQEWRQTLGREYWCLRRPVAVFFNNQFIGSDIELIKLTTMGNILMENIPRKNTLFIKEHFRKDYISYLRKTKRIYCYLDICVDDIYVGTLTFQLYSDLLPRTCENFKTLCLGNRGPLLSYKGSRIHRIVKQGWLQGGDIQYKTGGGGFSIFCDPLEDECFGISHDRRGILSMANAGTHSNGSQFFITLKPSKWMDTHYVAFGHLIEGVKVLKTLENMETFYECPLKKVEIKSCGKLDLGDIEDTDVLYKEEPIPKKSKRIEAISDQIVRLIMEALTDALARKEHTPNILDDGDVPSKMNLQLYFQGFYSLPESILEESAAYLRNLRRELLRVVKPSAMEIVETIMYDLLMAVLTRMTTLDDVRETIGHELYQKMISGIDMKLELCKKSYVKRLVDQIVSTAESMVKLVTKKILKMKKKSKNRKEFQKRMQNWVQSFVLQETFKGDNYLIAERPIVPPIPKEEKDHPKREGKPCCDAEKKKQEELIKKLKEKYAPKDLCCLGSQLHLDLSDLNLYDYFSICRYDLKKVPKTDRERMPLLDLIEISRFKLRYMRKQENRLKTNERLCTEKKIRKWMTEVVYTPETSWLKDSVFPKNCRVLDHMEEILYGAMTAGLLEMYYFMEEYLKLCGKNKQRLITRTIYPDLVDSEYQLNIPITTELTEAEHEEKHEKEYIEEDKEEHKEEYKEEHKEEYIEEDKEEHKEEYIEEDKEEHKEEYKEEHKEEHKEEYIEEDKEEPKEEEKEKKEEILPPCTCGHPCCVCAVDPNYKPPTLPLAEEPGELSAVAAADEAVTAAASVTATGSSVAAEPPSVKVCASDETLEDLNAFLAEKISIAPEEIDIRSFNWLKPYILENGCDLKTEFATQVHKWLDGDRFNCKGFISKQSLVTTASLLSLSFSVTELIKEENNLKTEIKNFIYDLWDLYFEEMFKEALLEYPPEEEEQEQQEPVPVVVVQQEQEQQEQEQQQKEEKDDMDEAEGHFDEFPQKISTDIPDFDFDKCCKVSRTETEEFKGENFEVQSAAKSKQHLETAQLEIKEVETLKESQASTHGIPTEAFSSSLVISEIDETPVGTVMKEDGGDEKDLKDNLIKKKKSPIIVQEIIDEPSLVESRMMPPYVLPFWVKFLTELTKQVLGALAKVSRLPRRLYFQMESELAFDDKMKDWFEFNAFNPQPTKGREIMDYIVLHHKSLTNLENSARSYLKKKKYSELLNRCTRFDSADNMADEIVADVIDAAILKTSDNETIELFVSNLLSSAVTSTPKRNSENFEEEKDEENSYNTSLRDSSNSELQGD